MMPRAMVDSNVLLDILTLDPKWFSWSSEIIERYAEDHILVINPIIYAEISVDFERIEELDSALPLSAFVREAIPWEAAFLAAKCFVKYRKRGGAKRSPLPDFFIGAHASIDGIPLITRDPARYRTYLPTLRLISP